MSQACQSCHHPLAEPPPSAQTSAPSQIPCGFCGSLNPIGHSAPPSIVVQPATGVTQLPTATGDVSDIARRVWFIEGQGTRRGPLTAVDVLAQRSAGAITDETPIFGPNMAAPAPLREVLPQLEARQAAPQSGWHPAAEAAWQQMQGGAAADDSGFGNEHTRAIVAPRGGTPPAPPAPSAAQDDFSGEFTRAIVAPRASSSQTPPLQPDPKLGASLFDEALKAKTQPAPSAVTPIQTSEAAARVQSPPRQSQVTMLGQSKAPAANRGLKVAIGLAVAIGLSGAGFAAWFVAQRSAAPAPAASAPVSAPASAAPPQTPQAPSTLPKK